MTIGPQIIKELNRRLAGRMVADLAEELDTPISTVRDFLKGRHKHVSKAANQRMADLLGVPAGRTRQPRATIQIAPATRARLTQQKHGKRESFDSVIVRLLDTVAPAVNAKGIPAGPTLFDIIEQIKEVQPMSIVNGKPSTTQVNPLMADYPDVDKLCKQRPIPVADQVNPFTLYPDAGESIEFDLCVCGHTREEHAPMPSLTCEMLHPNGEPCLCACFELDEEAQDA